jgi:hypothetical protein
MIKTLRLPFLMIFPIIGVILFAVLTASVFATPVISEFLADNVTGLKDEDGDEPDWIEIHNPDTSAVNLAGWALTDKADHEDEATRWVFPSVTLAPGEYLVVFASKKDRNDPTGNLHTHFSLSKNGEYLALLDPSGNEISEFAPSFPQQFSDISYGMPTGAFSFVNQDSALSYCVPDQNIGDTWRNLSFTDPDARFTATDGSGNPLHPGVGYDTDGGYDPILLTTVPDGTTNIYLRIPFDVDDPDTLDNLNLEMQYDDAFVAWINGVEVARSAGAPATPEWNSVSSLNHEANLDTGEIFDISGHLDILQEGNNVLTIQVINRSNTSSDLIGNPRLIARASSTGSASYLSPPTPGATNGEAFIPGPQIENITHTPTQPTDSDAITVNATITPRLGTVTSVQLIYRVMYGSEVSLPMTDDGSGVFTATIPASASAPGEMVRWKIIANDDQGHGSREPTFLDREGTNQSPEYFGTVITDPAVVDSLPVYAWFTQDVSNAHTRTGARASFFYNGEFHDNIFVRQRGGFTNGNSQKFNFNKGDSFQYDPLNPKVGEINLNAEGRDSSYLRQELAFDLMREGGCPASVSFPVQLRVNNGYDRVAIFIEQVDEDYLKRQTLPEDGALYKFVQRGNLRPVLNDAETGVEKKTRTSEDFSDLEALIAGLKGSLNGTDIENSGSLIHTPEETAVRDSFLFDNLNVPEIVDYLVGTILLQDTDDTRKNFYLYRDSEKSGEWFIFPWDKDFTWGLGEEGDDEARHPFWGDASHKNPNSQQWNILYDAVHNNPRIRAMILRRTRTLTEQIYASSATDPAAWPEPESAQLETSIDPVLNIDRTNLLTLFDRRRSDLYNNNWGATYGNESLVPATQGSGLVMQFGAVDYNPASADQDQEFFELINTNNEDLDISGWTITGGVTFTFAGGTVVPAGESIFVSPATAAFRQRSVSPTGGEGRFVVGPYSGHLSNFGETLTLSNANGTLIAETTYEGDPSDVQKYLVVSELHYHPAGDPASEFIELANISDTTTLDLTGVKFTAGIDFTFAGATITTLAPGDHLLIVRDITAFETTYGTAESSRIAGVFANGTALSNSGERLKIEDATHSTVHDFTYLDTPPWPTLADGSGPSLILRSPESLPDHNNPANWSTGRNNGTPGTSSPPFDFWLADRGGSDPSADPDQDGWSELQTYVLASDLRPRHSALLFPSGATTLTYAHRDSPDARVVVEFSHNLTDWNPGEEGVDYELVSDLPSADGLRDIELRISPALKSQTKTFARLIISVANP